MKTPVECCTFPSSKPPKVWEALRYEDGSFSCNCPGWTRRVLEDGSRTCRHVRAWITYVMNQGFCELYPEMKPCAVGPVVACWPRPPYDEDEDPAPIRKFNFD
jgi:hypothetical protein